MQRFFGLFVALCLAVPGGSARAGIAADPAAQVTALPPGIHARYNTIAHELLSREAAVSAVAQEMYDFLDALIDEAAKRIERKPRYGRAEALRAVEAIDRILIEMNVVYPAPAMGMVLQLSDGLRGRPLHFMEMVALTADRRNKRRADWIRAHARDKFFVNDCDTTAFLYLAVAEVLGLPLHLVELPGHNFIRYQDGADGFDWETMEGKLAPEGYYKAEWRIPDELVAARVYLAPMGRDDVLGYHRTVTSAAWSAKGDWHRVLADDAAAARLYPHGARVWNQWAWNLVAVQDRALRNGEAALGHALRAVSISRTPNFLDTLACVFAELGDFAKAVATERQARALARTKDYPLEPVEPEFAKQIQRFQRRQKCGDQPELTTPAPSRKVIDSLSDRVKLD